MNIIRLLGYLKAFVYATLLSFGIVVVAFCVAICVLMFVTLTLPIGSPFTWAIFRLFLAMAMIIATLFCFSSEAKKVVDNFEKGIKNV